MAMLGDVVKFQVYSVAPPEVRLSQSLYADSAIAQELYGDITVPVLRDPTDGLTVPVDYAKLKEAWKPYFVIPLASVPLAAATEAIPGAEPNRLALAYLGLLAGRQPNAGFFLAKAEAVLAVALVELQENMIATLHTALLGGALKAFPPRPTNTPLWRNLAEWKARGAIYQQWKNRQSGKAPVPLPYDGPALIATPKDAVAFYGDHAPADPRVLALQMMISAGPIGAVAGTLCQLRGCDTQTLIETLGAAAAVDGMALSAAAVATGKVSPADSSSPTNRRGVAVGDGKQPVQAVRRGGTRRESAGAQRPGNPRPTHTDGFDGRTSPIMATATKNSAINTSIRADGAESQSYNKALDQGEVGLQKPSGANISGPDFITAEQAPGGGWRVIANDAKSRTSAASRFPNATMKPAWKAEVTDAVAPGRLALGDAATEAAIRDAVSRGEVYFRQVNVDYAGSGQGQQGAPAFGPLQRVPWP